MSQLFNHYLFKDANLKAYYRFENSLLDDSLSGYTLTNNGSTDVAGKFGRGRNFVSASSQYAITSSATNLNTTGSQTFYVYINPTTVHTSYPVAISNSGGTIWRGFFINASAELHFEVVGLTSNSLLSTTPYIAGNWYHLVGVYDATAATLAIFVNGKKTSASVTGTATALTGDFAVGRLGTFNGQYYNGTLDEVGFWNRALSDNEVLSFYNSYKIENKLRPRIFAPGNAR